MFLLSYTKCMHYLSKFTSFKNYNNKLTRIIHDWENSIKLEIHWMNLNFNREKFKQNFFNILVRTSNIKIAMQRLI